MRLALTRSTPRRQVQATQAGEKPKYTGVWQARPLAAGCAGGPAARAARRPPRLLVQPLLHLLRAPGAHAGRLVAQGLTYMAKHEGLRGMMKGNGACCTLRLIAPRAGG
jgi:hypothetical protein